MELSALLDLYRAEPAEREQLQALSESRGERGWWAPYSAVMTRAFAEYVAFEAEAAEIWHWLPAVVPGHLQTEEYARAVMEAMGTPNMDQLLKVRMLRQHHLASREVRFRTILDQSVLTRIVGSTADHAAQLRRLAEVAEAPYTQLQILPYAQGAHAVGVGGFTVLTYLDGAQVVWGDTVAGDSCWEDDRPELCLAAFERLHAAALDPAQSARLIHDALEGHVMEPDFRKSSRSGGGQHCVEVAWNIPDKVLVRDSKAPDGPVLEFTHAEWDAFLGGAVDGEFDLS